MSGGIKRPLFICCGTFVVSMFIFSLCPFSVKAVISAAALIAAAVSLFWIKSRKRTAVLIVSLAVVAAFAESAIYNDVYLAGIKAYDGKTFDLVECRVTDENCVYPYFSSFDAKITSLDGKKVSFDARIEISSEIDAKVGHIVKLNGVTFSLPEGEEKNYLSGGIVISAEAEGAEYVSSSGGLDVLSGKLSSSLSSKVRVLLGREDGGFVSALLIGNRDGLSERTQSAFRRLGISHLLAVSGLHLSVMIGFLDYLMRRLSRREWLVYLCDVAAIIFFSVLTGMRLTVIRSAIMLILWLTARLLGSGGDSLTSLSVAASVIVIFSPSAVSDCGFLLSVTATLALILFAFPVGGRSGGKAGRFVSYVLSSVLSAAAVLWFTLPLQWWFFGSVSLWSPVTNIVFVPLASVILFLAPINLVLYGILPTAAALPLKAVTGFTVSLADVLADSAGKPIYLGHSFTPYCFFASVAVFVMIAVLTKEKKRKILISFVPQITFVLLFGVCLFADSRLSPKAEVYAANVGTNDFILAECGEKTVFIDVSDGSFSNMKRATDETLNEMKNTGIDAVMLTHYHTKQGSSVAAYLDRYRPGVLILPFPDGNDAATVISEYAVSNNVNLLYYDAKGGDTLDFYGLKITVFPSEEVKNRVHSTLGIEISGEESFTYISASSLGKTVTEGDTVVGSHTGVTPPDGWDGEGSYYAINRKTADKTGIKRCLTGKNCVVFSKTLIS